ncbi:MAG: single-stranded DNA-binding protein [Anaerolineae bacterium]|nr:single-stranded DNA-binding protein [Anaerolineae bacterium]
MYQKLTIVGNVGNDPEMRYTPSGQAVTNLNIATNRRWTTGDGQQQEETVWFRVSVWGKQAEVCNQYLSKGRQVLVEGRLTPDKDTGGPRIWTDQNGNPRASFEMTAFEVKFLGSGGSGGGRSEGHSGYSDSNSSSAPVSDEMGITEDEIPF